MKKTRNELYYQMPYVNQTTLEKLSDEEAGAILKALNRFRQGDREQMPTLGAEIFYHQYCDHIEEEHIRWDEERARKSAGGKNKKPKEDTPTEDKILEDTSRYLKIVEDTSIKQNKTNTKQNETNTKQKQNKTKSGDKSPSSSMVGEEEDARVSGKFVFETIDDTAWMETMAMKTHLNREAVIEKLKEADSTLIADGDYPKNISAYKARAHRLILSEINKAKDNGSNEHNAADLLSKLREQYSRQGVQPEGKISN